MPGRKSVSVTVKEESPATCDRTNSTCASPALRGPEVSRKRGKAPPIEYFSAEDPEILLDDWLPTVENAAKWNGWTEEKHLMQLEGHLKGKARQEWTLISKEERSVRNSKAARTDRSGQPVRCCARIPSSDASKDKNNERLHSTKHLLLLC